MCGATKSLYLYHNEAGVAQCCLFYHTASREQRDGEHSKLLRNILHHDITWDKVVGTTRMTAHGKALWDLGNLFYYLTGEIPVLAWEDWSITLHGIA